MPGSSGESIKVFQFDQCFDDQGIADDCNAQGLAKAYRFPKRLKGKDDSEVIDELFIKRNTIITTDLGMVEEHLDHVPDFHPGVLSICNGHANPQTITSKIIKKILAKFKADFPRWHATDLSNTFAEITPVGIDVFHVEDGKLVRDKYLSFDEKDWPFQLESILSRNAARTRAINPSSDGA